MNLCRKPVELSFQAKVCPLYRWSISSLSPSGQLCDRILLHDARRQPMMEEVSYARFLTVHPGELIQPLRP